MNSEKIHDYVNELASAAQLAPHAVTLLRESMACFLGVLARAVGAEAVPDDDLLRLSIRLLLLDDAVTEMATDTPVTEQIHYLTAMGFEQTGTLLARFAPDPPDSYSTNYSLPQSDDQWYRLALAVLHYLAGGHRIQARTALRQLHIWSSRVSQAVAAQYQEAYEILLQLYRSNARRPINTFNTRIARVLTLEQEPSSSQDIRLSRLVKRIRERRQSLLSELGRENEVEWLHLRAIHTLEAVKFWKGYLARLETRGITAFTQEQVGAGFEKWLHPDSNLLVTLPTGSGKSIIGELLTALCLCREKQVIWILPTRSLVRQVKRELRDAFRDLDVTVEELPTTDDFLPVFLDDIEGGKHVAVSTPEKLHALLRRKPSAATGVGLVVFDEAHLLFKENRGTTAESVLANLARSVKPQCVLMTASLGDKVALESCLRHLIGPEGHYYVLSSELRPTRRINGVLTTTSIAGKKLRPDIVLYPPEPPDRVDTSASKFCISFVHDAFRTREVKATLLAKRAVRSLSFAGVRTIWFVSSRKSAESQAHELANTQRRAREQVEGLSLGSIARLHIELGRHSTIEDTISSGIAAHHGSLTGLEQSLVEQGYLDGRIHTIVATPTLAEGVNLPADVAIVGFLQRHNEKTGKKEPLSIIDIQNMLGRAGRAGQVPDGICLITDPINNSSASYTLRKHKHHFFSSPETKLSDSGLRQLLKQAVIARIHEDRWLTELSELNFHEAQTLITFALNSTSDSLDPYTALLESITGFPSLRDLPESERTASISAVANLVENLHRHVKDDPLLLLAVKRTGFPPEVLQFYFDRLRGASNLVALDPVDKWAWLDDTVQACLNNLSNRNWCRRFLTESKVNADLAVQTAKLWRSGVSIAEVESYWVSHHGVTPGRTVQLATGKFLSQKISSFAQFWGALAVCWELSTGNLEYEPTDEVIQKSQTFVREGVENIFQVEWLRQIGGLDRGLAHKLEETSVYDRSSTRGMRHYITQVRREWKVNPTILQHRLGEPYASALQDIL